MIASVVLAVCVVAMATSLAASSQQSAEARQRILASSLAKQLFEEIAAKPFADPTNGALTLGPEIAQGEVAQDRSTFDNIDDYNGYTDTTTVLTDRTGSAVGTTSASVGGGVLLRRSVTVTYGQRPTGHTAPPSADFALVTVNITEGSDVIYTASRLFTNYTRTR